MKVRKGGLTREILFKRFQEFIREKRDLMSYRLIEDSFYSVTDTGTEKEGKIIGVVGRETTENIRSLNLDEY